MRRTIVAFAAAAVLGGGTYLAAGSNATAEEVTLYKSPQCGCCDAYADHLQDYGFSVTVDSTRDLVAMNREAGIPDRLQSCHLAFVDGYVVSGHVPMGTIDRLLSERPEIGGVTLPGMPMGSPGMAGTKAEPFAIYQIGDERPQIFSVQ